MEPSGYALQESEEPILAPAPHPHKSRNASIQLVLDSTTFALPQEPLKGRIRLIAKEKLKANRIILQVVGQEHALWRSVTSGAFATAQERRVNQIFLNRAFSVINFPGSAVEEGIFTKQFSFDLLKNQPPDGLQFPPSTLILDRGCQYAGIIYYLIALLQGPAPLSCTQPILVIQEVKQLDQRPKTFETEEIVAGCCSSPSPLRIQASINKSGFFSDQEMRVKVELNKGRLKTSAAYVSVTLIACLSLRESGNVTVQEIKAFTKKLNYNSDLETEEKQVAIELTALQLSENEERAGQESEVLAQQTSGLQPSIKMSAIQVTYKLQIRATGSSCLSYNISHDFPVVIKKRPLYLPPNIQSGQKLGLGSNQQLQAKGRNSLQIINASPLNAPAKLI